jgi:molybdenum cofactor synthesis domain-containing protein
MRPQSDIKVLSVNISEKKGTVKHPVEFIQLDQLGVQNDAHAGPWHRQVSLLAEESILKFASEAKRKIGYGEFAENITTRGIVLHELKPLDRLVIGDCELQVTQIGKKCHGDNCAIFREVGNCVMPKEGIFCRVIRYGRISAGDPVTCVPRNFQALVITLSDRASQGVYEDKSGPEAVRLLEEFFLEEGWKFQTSRQVIPDEGYRLKALLDEAVTEGIDFVVTTGGTGIGPRDITPEIVRSVIEKEIPGIMDMIRMKCGADKPGALLSRSVAGTAGKTLIYSLPGSVKAVNEYMAEIRKTMRHAVYMMHGLDLH